MKMEDFSVWIEKNKALWTRVYDEVIAPSLEEEWKRREAAQEENVRQSEEHRQIFDDYTKDLIIQNARLSRENGELRSRTGRPALDDSVMIKQEAPLNHSTESTSTDQNLVHDYDELNKRYHDLLQKMKYLERKNQAVMQKNKDMKDSVRAWQEYADRQVGRQKSKAEIKGDDFRPMYTSNLPVDNERPHISSSPGSIATRGRSPSAGSARSRQIAQVLQGKINDDMTTLNEHTTGELPTPKPQNVTRTLDALQEISASTVPNHVPNEDEGLQQSCRPTLDDLPHPSSSQTTVEEAATASRHSSYTGHAEIEDDDFPQFVSERSLKRKHGQQSRIQIYNDHSSDGTPVRPFRVKEEQFSSPPNGQILFRRETMDLDDLASSTLQTPRHPRHRQHASSAKQSILRHQRSNSAPFSQALCAQESMPSSHTSTAANSVPSCESRALSEPSNNPGIVTDILQPLDSNIVASLNMEPPNKRVRRVVGIENQKHSFLTESGEETPSTKHHTAKLSPSVVRARFNQKLHATRGAAAPTPARVKVEQDEEVSTTPAHGYTPTGTVKRYRSRERLQISTPTEITPDNRPQWTMSTFSKTSKATKRSGSPIQKLPPLRQKPVVELKLGDFKPNPAYNQGYSYAFSETVRKRGDRMCLPGCTNPQCCGSTFRALAEAQAPLTSSQEAALLEDYLGEAYDNTNLTQMAVDEREELVLQARTRKMAKENGKHKQVYEGRRTPPGFWRVDFPSTQEQQEDRERAKQQEKQQIQERWMEAQRRGGRWIFRDE